MSSQITLVDSHAHLDYPPLAGDLSGVVSRAKDAGVAGIITVGTTLEGTRKSIEIARAFPGVVWAAGGIHPNEASAHFGEFAELSRLFETQPLVAVGETGLDFYRERTCADEQRAAFRAHLELALARDLPVIIHIREAYDEALKVLDSMPTMPRGVLHCFSGNLDFAREALGRGLYISIAGQVTYKNAEDLRRVVAQIPLGRLLVETDCPYLAPVPRRGKDNEPAYARFTAEAVAGLTGVTLADLARTTTANAWRLFRIGEKPLGGSIAYEVGHNLYLNITNRCPNDCPWCFRNMSPYLRGNDLVLDADPSYEEIIAALPDIAKYGEIVFCGYGEPTMRLDVLKKVAAYLKAQGAKVRLDTNGMGSLANGGRDVAGELAGLVDSVSISLNSADPEEYVRLCRPKFGLKAYEALIQFIRRARETIGDVTVTVVDLPGLDIPAAGRVADGLGVKFRIRPYVPFG